MPRPRAPTRELFEFTNRRRTGGKCDLYRCKRCGREMLENTHRFAIHICTCKKATDEDREVAKGQLRKTKKYRMRTDNSAAPLAYPASAGCPSEMVEGQYSMSSPPTLHNSQELLMLPPPTPMRRVNDYQSQQNKLDIFECQLDSTATVFDTLPRAMTTTPTLFDFEDHCRMAAASNLFGSHRRYYHPNPDVSTQHQMAADGGMIFDNHHQNLNACSGMTFDQRPAHHNTLIMPSRQRHEMPLPSYRHERQWRGSIYSIPFESRPESARGMSGLQPHMF